MAFAQLMLESPTADPEARETAEVIEREARRAARIVSNLLTFAREREPTRALTSVNAVIEAAVELHRYALRAQQVELRCDLEPLLPRTWADDGQLQQVFANLITNAEQALAGWSGERRVTVTSRQRGAQIVVQVADTGPGIDPARAERIFNPFFTTKAVGEGTGLGLSISHGILREHQGSIRVEARAGGGAVFTVELPIVSAPPSAHATAVSSEIASPRRVRDARARILVVDDEPAIRTVIERFLTGLGYVVDEAAGGHEAVRRLEAATYDAVLLDLRMPDLSGDAVYAAVHARDPEQAARTIFITGDVRSEEAWRFIAATGCAALSKPFVLHEVARTLDAQLAARSRP
jgi:two-component system NtrC family sensor kinase